MTQGQMLQLQAWSYGGMTGASSATFSPCGKYRYDLRRTWQPKLAPLVFVGLNPSTADAFRDDPTIRRILGFASSWGCGGLIMLNAFALRSTDPRGLTRVEDPIGPENDVTIERVLRSMPDARVVLGWGTHGTLNRRDAQMSELVMKCHGRPECFGRTQNGQPKHPLYLSSRTPTQPWEST